RGEGQGNGHRLRRVQDEIGEFLEMRVRHPVGPVQDHLAHPAQEVEQDDARIGEVVVEPFAGVDLLAHEREQLVEGSVVEGDGRQRHGQMMVIWWMPEATRTFSPTRSSWNNPGASTNAAVAT